MIVAYTQSSSPPLNNHQRREIGNDAVWTLSSAKTGNGVQQLRDDNTSTFWQSDGSQPHLINIQFMKKTRIQQISLYFDFKSDESYTPNKISIRAGNNLQDLKQVQYLELKQPSGWYTVPLRTKMLNSTEKNYISTINIQLAILQNQHSGKDTHIRQIKIFGPRQKINQGLGFPDFKSPEITQYYSIH